VPGGRMAEMYGTKKVLGYSMLITAILGFLAPLAAYTSYYFIFAILVAQGLCEGVTYPSLNPHISRWVPSSERSRFTSFVFLGGTAGTVLTLPVSGILLNNYPWEVVFYATSVVSLIWCLLWFLLDSDLPEEHPRVSAEEKELILASRSFDPVKSEKLLSGNVFLLLRDMLKNKYVWVIMVWSFCQNWGYIMVVTMTPTFMEKVLHFNIKDNGFLSMIPHIVRALAGPVAGQVYDFLAKRGVAHLTLQKGFVLILAVGLSAGLIVLPQLATWELRFYCVAVMAFAFGCTGCDYSGGVANTQSIAPNYSGTVYGLRNFAAQITGFMMPAVISAFTKCKDCEGDATRWGYAFWIFAGLCLFGMLVFLLFATTQEQPFNSNDYTGGKALEAAKLESNFKGKQEVDQTKEP